MQESLWRESHGIAHFIGQADAVGRVVLALLVVMSIASWTVIVVKAVRHLKDRRRARQFSGAWLASPGRAFDATLTGSGPSDDAFATLLREAHAAADQARALTAGLPGGPALADELVTRALALSVAATAERLERGLTALASVGSVAPFVGLFGTVWGIYQALLVIGASGQSTLDRIAGPVGEALIMTAFGLFVAIPAVLAYNAFVRSNRVALAGLDRFAAHVHRRMLAPVVSE